MQEVGLSPVGGSIRHGVQRWSEARLAIARALVLEPKLLVLDEALSGWISRPRRRLPTCCSIFRHRTHSLFLISHDLALVARLAETIA